jgi:DNA-binding NarL/FixJ family response regulator
LIDVVIVIEVRLYREAVARLLREQPDLRLRAEADGADRALLEIERTRPDVVLLDLGIARALDVVRRTRTASPQTRVVALGFGGTDDEAIAAAEAGLGGYIGIRQPLDDVLSAIRAVMAGEAPCDGRIVAALLRCVAARAGDARRRSPLDELTSREQRILELIASGLSNKEIARELVIGVATVKSHVHAILRKLEVDRRGAAAELLRRSQFVAAPLDTSTV